MTGMSRLPDIVSPEMWLRQLFSARVALDGGVVRRKVRDVERIIGRERFEYEVRRRGFRAIENAGHYIVLCNRETVRLID